MARKTPSLTEGKVSTALLRFALPFLAANILQALYGAIDFLIIGRFCSSPQLAAVSVSSQVMVTLLSLIIGVSTGSTVLVGQCIGEQDDKKSAHAVGSSVSLFAIIAVVLTPLMVIFALPILRLMDTPVEAEAYAKQYLVICSCGLPFILGYNVISGFLRGFGNSKTPMIFVAVSSCVNLAADLLLVGVAKMGAAGAALATVFSQLISFLMALGYLLKNKFPFEFHRRHFKPSGKSIGFILKVGIPLAAQEVLVNVSFLLITTMVNGIGVVAAAAVGIVEKILGFVMMPPMAISSAVTTMSAQNIGAKKPERALSALRYGILFALIFGVAITVASFISPESITGLFSKDIEVIRMAATYLKPYSTDCILICIIFTMNGYFNGCGKSFISFAHSMVATFGFRVPLCYFSLRYCVGTLTPMGWCMPLASISSLIICGVYFFWLKKKGIGRETGENLAAR